MFSILWIGGRSRWPISQGPKHPLYYSPKFLKHLVYYLLPYNKRTVKPHKCQLHDFRPVIFFFPFKLHLVSCIFFLLTLRFWFTSLCFFIFSKSWIHTFFFFLRYLPTIALHVWATRAMRSRRRARKLLDLLMFSNKWINQCIFIISLFPSRVFTFSSSEASLHIFSKLTSSLSERFVWVSQAIFSCIVSCMT